MVAKPLLALAATAVLIALAAAAAPERGLQTWRIARRRALFDIGSAPAVLAVAILGVALGIPAALGLVPGLAVTLVGALVAAMVGRVVLAGRTAPGSALAAGWLVVLSWCLLAGTLRYETGDLELALSAQVIIGPGPLAGNPSAIGASVLAAVVGLFAAGMWAATLPSLEGSPEHAALDSVLRWGESALAGAAVAATVWGPSLGALTMSSSQPGLAVRVAISFLATAAGVTAASALRRIRDRVPAAAGLGAGALGAVAALIVASLG